ncbi:MAG TPA: DUF4190 domain-containing protein [Bacteroidia bacterium]|nr:DUF4190 domain-containing protein [Bacteroidia bacterium]
MSNLATPPAIPTKTSTQAIWSLVLGILSIGCLWLLGSIPAIVLGIAAVRGIDRSDGALKGRGLGIAGIVTGSVGILTGFVTIAILAASAMPAYNIALQRAKERQEIGRIQQIMTACMVYASDHNGRYPESLALLVEEEWIEASQIESTLAPGSPFLYRPGFTDVSDPAEILLASPMMSLRQRVAAFADGRVEAIPEDRFQSDYAHLFP